MYCVLIYDCLFRQVGSVTCLLKEDQTGFFRGGARFQKF